MEFYPTYFNASYLNNPGQLYPNSFYNQYYKRFYGYGQPAAPYPVHPAAQYTNDDAYEISGSRLPTRKNVALKSDFHEKCTSRVFKFSKEDIHAALYGYVQDKHSTTLHSLSGVQRAKESTTTSIDAKQSSIFQAELPQNLAIKEINMNNVTQKGVFARACISKGTVFGPYTGSMKSIQEIGEAKCNCSYSWEIFSEGRLQHFIDGSLDSKNWMKYVNCARYNAEQNLALIQNQDELFYKATKDIVAEQELLVWYGNDYVKYLEVPMSLQENKIQPKVSKKKLDVTALSGSFPCKRCGKIFSYEYYREKHLKYTRCVDMGDRKFPCHLCQRSFEKKDRLRIHILHVHQKYRPHVCKTCGKRFSQSSSLNKHSRVHTGERPYSCPHCPKSFTASSILRTHLRQHNGERPFKCKFCGKAFASHAAHDSHVRRTHDKLKKFLCKICSKTFSMEFELKFHLSTHTLEETDMLAQANQLSVIGKDNYIQEDDNNNKSEIGTFVSGRTSTFSEASEHSLVIDM